MKIAVIGAGPAGTTAAYQLSKAIPGGKVEAVDLYEASTQVGGLSKTLDLWGEKVDLGPHRFFSSDRRINELWLEVVGDDYAMVDRLTRIFYKNKFFYYPLKPFNALFNLGLWEATKCVVSYAMQRVKPGEEDNTFESWVTRRFGTRLYNIFFKTYTEKLWGIPCNQLDSDFAAQRIKKLNLYEAIKNAVLGGKGNTHKTLVDQFAYPVKGTGMVYETMVKHIIANGGQVLLSTPVDQVVTENGKAVGLRMMDGSIRYYDHIISSMPLSLMVKKLPEVPAEISNLASQLKFRNTILVYLRVEADNLFPDQWLYVHANDLETGRITNFANWVPEIRGGKKDSILCLEYWCYDEDEIWSRDEQSLIELAKAEIKKTGLTGKAQVMEGHVHKIHRCYPVYFNNYKSILQPIEKYLSTIEGLQVIGRYGAYKYNNQDHSILMGMMAAENLLQSSDHDLWAVNTDYESYQENTVITQTGLSVSE